MVVKTLRPDDICSLKPGTYITIVKSLPEVVTSNHIPVLVPGEEGMEQFYWENVHRYGTPFEVLYAEYPFLACRYACSVAGASEGDVVKIDLRYHTVAKVNKKYALAFRKPGMSRPQAEPYTRLFSGGPIWIPEQGDANE